MNPKVFVFFCMHAYICPSQKQKWTRYSKLVLISIWTPNFWHLLLFREMQMNWSLCSFFIKYLPFYLKYTSSIYFDLKFWWMEWKFWFFFFVGLQNFHTLPFRDFTEHTVLYHDDALNFLHMNVYIKCFIKNFSQGHFH